MAQDVLLTERLRDAIGERPNVTQKAMMGGVCFMIDGNMLAGADRHKDGSGRFMFRVGKDNEAEALARPGAVPLMMGGRRMGGMVFVDERTCDHGSLKAWVALALLFVGTLPAK